MAGSSQPSISLWPRTSGVAKTSGKVFKSHWQSLDSIHVHLPTTAFKGKTWIKILVQAMQGANAAKYFVDIYLLCMIV